MRTIFLGYCYADKKWLDRVHAAIAPVDGETMVIAWDERKLREKKWRSEFEELLADCDATVLLVSDRFLDSDFVQKVRFPILPKEARSRDLQVRWVLLSHCLHEAAGFDESLALNPPDWPLDGLSTSRREAVLAEIGSRINGLAKGESVDKPVSPAPTEKLPFSPFLEPLAQIIEGRKQTIALFRNWLRALIPATVAMILLSLLAGIDKADFPLLLVMAGFGLLLGGLILVIKSRIDCIDQGIVTVRCVRTGLTDETLPTTQRSKLLQRAQEILGRA